MSTNDITFMVNCISKDIVGFLMSDYEKSLEESLNILYDSETFQKLSDPKTGLYFQSSRYVYQFLKNEIETGIMS
mgnify:CR=1 FL=1